MTFPREIKIFWEKFFGKDLALIRSEGTPDWLNPKNPILKKRAPPTG
jgi:hypothetical protein